MEDMAPSFILKLWLCFSIILIELIISLNSRGFFSQPVNSDCDGQVGCYAEADRPVSSPSPFLDSHNMKIKPVIPQPQVEASLLTIQAAWHQPFQQQQSPSGDACICVLCFTIHCTCLNVCLCCSIAGAKTFFNLIVISISLQTCSASCIFLFSWLAFHPPGLPNPNPNLTPNPESLSSSSAELLWGAD